MADISQINIDGTNYTIKDTTAREAAQSKSGSFLLWPHNGITGATWGTDDTFPEYPYYYDISISGITSAWTVQMVAPASTSTISDYIKRVQFYPVTQALDGKIRIRMKNLWSDPDKKISTPVTLYYIAAKGSGTGTYGSFVTTNPNKEVVILYWPLNDANTQRKDLNEEKLGKIRSQLVGSSINNFDFYLDTGFYYVPLTSCKPADNLNLGTDNVIFKFSPGFSGYQYTSDIGKDSSSQGYPYDREFNIAYSKTPGLQTDGRETSYYVTPLVSTKQTENLTDTKKRIDGTLATVSFVTCSIDALKNDIANSLATI